jgi:ribonucleoside-diphosphate reductase alpha chain
MPQPVRRQLPDERAAVTHKFEIAGHEGWITVGLYPDGLPGEIFLVMASRDGSATSGFADAFAAAITYALQYGVPLQDLVDRFSHVRFEPSGTTRNAEIRFAKSIVDYVFRWLALKFLTVEGRLAMEELARKSAQKAEVPNADLPPAAVVEPDPYAPPCSTCGTIMKLSGPGPCYKCPNCGNTTGCA